MIDVCLICARGGSKEIKNKNITKIFGEAANCVEHNSSFKV